MPIQVLTVDDEDFDRRLMHRALSSDARFGDIIVTDSGENALRSASSLSGNAVIVTDVRMPMMDGFELIARLKACEQTRYLPIVALSSSNSTDDRNNALEAGASSFIPKPSSKTEKLAMVSEIAAVTYAHYEQEIGRAASPSP